MEYYTAVKMNKSVFHQHKHDQKANNKIIYIYSMRSFI